MKTRISLLYRLIKWKRESDVSFVTENRKKPFSAASSVAGLCAMNTDVKYALIAYNNFASTILP